MPKFYVQSGNIQEIVTAGCQVDAAIAAIRRNTNDPSKFAEAIFAVSERGFVNDRADFQCMSDEVVGLDEVLEAMSDYDGK